MRDQLPRVSRRRKGQRKLSYLSLILHRCVYFIQADIGTAHVKVIDAQIVSGALILHNIVSPEHPADIFLHPIVRRLLDNQYIDLPWLCPQLVLIVKGELSRLLLQFELHSRIKCRMPLENPAFLPHRTSFFCFTGSSRSRNSCLQCLDLKHEFLKS